MDKFYRFGGDGRYFASSNIAAVHAFSTRLGGASENPALASMNLGFGRGDDEETVIKNYGIFLGALGKTVADRVYANQIHSDIVRYADRAGTYDDCDGFYTDKAGLVLTVRVADCVPILFCDTENRVIGAVHAGWRGSCASIAPKCVDKMVSASADKNKIQVAVGASIHSCCFEVRDDFYDSAVGMLGRDEAEKLIIRRDGRMYADIVGLNVRLLENNGIPRANISVCGSCTCCQPGLFFSHRASGGVRGTMCAAITL